MRRSEPRWVSQRTSSAATSAAANGNGESCCLALLMDARRSGGLTLWALSHPLRSPFVNRRNREPSMAKRIVDVLVPVALDQTYSYRVPAGLAVEPGDVVRVPL